MGITYRRRGGAAFYPVLYSNPLLGDTNREGKGYLAWLMFTMRFLTQLQEVNERDKWADRSGDRHHVVPLRLSARDANVTVLYSIVIRYFSGAARRRSCG